MFKDKEVDTKVKCKLGFFDGREPKESDLENVTDIFLTNLNVKGEKIGTDISEIIRIKKLKSLNLKGFELTDDIVSIIDSFQDLEWLGLYSCSSKETITMDLSNLKSLMLDNCKTVNLTCVNLPESVLVVNGGVIDLSKLVNSDKVKNLEIKSSEIIYSGILREMKNLKTLNIDGSVLDDEKVLDFLKSKKVSVSYEYEYHPIR